MDSIGRMATNERAQNRIYRVRGAATRYSKNIEKITGNVPGMAFKRFTNRQYMGLSNG